MARLAWYACERAGEIALRDLHVADLVVADREVALPLGVARVGAASRSAIARLGLVRLAARPADRPARDRTSPILLWLTERSRCHSALPGSRAASRSAIARLAWYASQRAAQIALRDLHVADPVRG